MSKRKWMRLIPFSSLELGDNFRFIKSRAGQKYVVVNIDETHVYYKGIVDAKLYAIGRTDLATMNVQVHRLWVI